MKYYTIKKDSPVRFFCVADDIHIERGNETLGTDKVFNETWFEGYKKCDCCDTLVASFYIGKDVSRNGIEFHHYATTDAVNVTEDDSAD